MTLLSPDSLYIRAYRESSGFLELRFLLSPTPRSGRYAIAPLLQNLEQGSVMVQYQKLTIPFSAMGWIASRAREPLGEGQLTQSH